MPAAAVASVQTVVNAIADLINADPIGKNLTIGRTPHYQQRLENKASCHIFAMRRDSGAEIVDTALGNQNHYMNTLLIAIVISVPQSAQNDKDRRMHTIEEAIENIIIDNQTIAPASLPTDVQFFQMLYVSSDYELLDEGEMVSDHVLITVEVQYARIRN